METMQIDYPEWLPELSDEQMLGYGIDELLNRYAKGVRLAEFRELFWWKYGQTPPRWGRSASWIYVMRHFGYTEDAGWCYID